MRPALRAASGLLACVQLAGCGQSADAPAANPAQTSYYIVTVTQPESLDQHLAGARSRYQACVTRAEAARLPVKPFPPVPEQYFFERQTYASDGKTWMTRDEHYYLDPSLLAPTTGCATRFTVTSASQYQRGDRLRTVEITYDGQRQESEDRVHPPSGPRLADLAAYPIFRTIGGHKLRCQLPAEPSPKKPSELCVPDSGSLMPANPDGLPIPVYQRIANVQRTTDLVTTPQVLQIGGRIDPALFNDPPL